MADRLVLFGFDECHYSLVLASAGYRLESCEDSLQKLRAVIETTETDAIIVSGSGNALTEEAVALARTLTSAPVVFFPQGVTKHDPSKFDFVVPAATPPAEWLAKIAEIVKASSHLQSQARLLREQAISLRQQTRATRETARATRDDARQERSKSERFRRK